MPGGFCAAAARHLAADAPRDARDCPPLGFGLLYAPLRPTEKEPLTPFAVYVQGRRADGLPSDAWICMHVRAGATVVKVAPGWDGSRRDNRRMASLDGSQVSRKRSRNRAGALCPIDASLEQNHGVEPNLWLGITSLDCTTARISAARKLRTNFTRRAYPQWPQLARSGSSVSGYLLLVLPLSRLSCRAGGSSRRPA